MQSSLGTWSGSVSTAGFPGDKPKYEMWSNAQVWIASCLTTVNARATLPVLATSGSVQAQEQTSHVHDRSPSVHMFEVFAWQSATWIKLS